MDAAARIAAAPGITDGWGVYEMLEMSREMAEAAAHDSATQFMLVARKHMQGKMMLDHALKEMKLGHTTAFEVMGISNRIED